MSNVDRPAYRILSVNGFFGPDDNLYREGECIYFDDEPNEEMEPLNEAAKNRITVYLEKLEALGKEVAIKTGKAYVGRPRNLDGVIESAKEVQRANMAIMKAEKDTSNIEYFEPEPIAEVGNVNPKRGRGRPAFKNVDTKAA